MHTCKIFISSFILLLHFFAKILVIYILLPFDITQGKLSAQEPITQRLPTSQGCEVGPR